MLQEIKNKVAFYNLIQQVEVLIERPYHFSLKWLEAHRWVVAPMEDTFSPQSAELIAAAASRRGYQHGYALSLEPSDTPETLSLFEVPFTPQGILETHQDYLSLVNLVIIPEDASFAVLKESGYFYLVGGNPDFVADCVQDSLESVRQDFQEYIQDPTFSPSTRSFLMSILERYAVSSGTAFANDE